MDPGEALVPLGGEAGAPDAGALADWPAPLPHAVANDPSAATLTTPPMKRRRDQRCVVVSVTIRKGFMTILLPSVSSVTLQPPCTGRCRRQSWTDALGGGGVTGIAWETGLIAGLAERGIDLAAADVIVGTSAGSVVGTDIACGREPEALYQAQLAPPAPETACRMGWDVIGRLLWVMSTSRDPVRARARLGRWALAAPTMPEASRRKVFEDRLPASDWPATMLKVTAVDARTGQFVVFDAAGEAGLVDAVAASCAVPGVWPPVTIGSRRFVDGGVRSVANADLAAGYERVLIVAPVAQGIGHMTSPRRQAAALSLAGARVALVRPDRAAAHAIGRNVLDVSRRAAAAAAGRAQAAAAAAAVRAVWQPGGGPAASG